jgi:hypothetical protein
MRGAWDRNSERSLRAGEKQDPLLGSAVGPAFAENIRTTGVHLLCTSAPLVVVGSLLVCSAVGAHEEGTPWDNPDLPVYNKWPAYIDLIGASCNLASGSCGLLVAAFTLFLDKPPPELFNRIVLVVLLTAWIPFLQNSFIFPVLYQKYGYNTTGLQGTRTYSFLPTPFYPLSKNDLAGLTLEESNWYTTFTMLEEGATGAAFAGPQFFFALMLVRLQSGQADEYKPEYFAKRFLYYGILSLSSPLHLHLTFRTLDSPCARMNRCAADDRRCGKCGQWPANYRQVARDPPRRPPARSCTEPWLPVDTWSTDDLLRSIRR